MRQHLACARAVAEISGGTLSGAELNSQELTFTPGTIRAGNYRFVVGSAGSTILIAQTVLPCLLRADGSSTVVIEGGTHAANAPIFEFFDRVYLSCLRRMGATVSATLETVGFYPAGGGRIRLEIAGSDFPEFSRNSQTGGSIDVSRYNDGMRGGMLLRPVCKIEVLAGLFRVTFRRGLCPIWGVCRGRPRSSCAAWGATEPNGTPR